MSLQSQAIAIPMQDARAGASTHVLPQNKSQAGQVRLSVRQVTILAAPVTVIATMLVGSVVLSLTGLPLYAGEMISGGIVNLVAGLLAAATILAMMGKGTVGVAQAGILGIAIRCGTVLMGILFTQLLPLGFDKTILVYWAIAFYFPMLIVESALIAWLSNKLAH